MSHPLPEPNDACDQCVCPRCYAHADETCLCPTAAGSAATPPQAACAESSLLAWGQHLLASQPEAGHG